MSLFRKDPFGSAWVLISPERGLEASDFGSVTPPEERSALSPGETGEAGEILAVRPSSSGVNAPDWRIRVIPHPSSLLQQRPFVVEGDGPFLHGNNSGWQELVVEHPDARQRLDTMPRDHLVDVLRLYRERVRLLGGRQGVRHVQVTRSVGRAAGALFDHPYGQVLAVPVPSRWLEEEIAAAQEHHAASGRCLFCEVLSAELELRQRIVTQNADFVAIAPYASKTPFETWVVPRKHGADFAGLAGNSLPALAEVLQSVLGAVNAALAHPPYNFVVHTLPHAAEHYHWHIEILPRLTSQAGFDWGNGFYVNPTPPEDAARFLREAMALREVAP